MARNLERDAAREKERRRRLLSCGFELFSERGIENVSLKEVAEKADVGIATLYNYYQNKTKLVIAISAHIWGKVWEEGFSKFDKETFEKMNSYQRVEAYIDCIIELYNAHPEILRYSSDYKAFIRRQGIDSEEVKEHLEVLSQLDNNFHISYENAREDGSIRTDIPEKELYTSVALTILGMAERYAIGLVWSRNDNNDYNRELQHLKDMILSWVKG